MKEFVDNKYGQRKAKFFRDQVVSNAQAAMARMRADAVNNPEVFVDTPMAAFGTSMYNGMSGQDILSMYDKKQNAYNSINPFNGLAQSFTDMTKYFNDPKYFAHKQEFYINDDYAKGLSEDDIANAFMRKGIASDMAKTVAYDYFNPQQTDTTDISNMSRDDIKAMRQKERDNYRQMKQDQKDWFGSATYIGGYAPSYACGGIKKMVPGGVTDTEVITGATDTGDTNTADKSTSTGAGESTGSKTPSNSVTPPAAPNDTYGRSYINISTPWGTGRVFVDNNNIDVRRNGRRLAIWGNRNPSTYRVNTNYTTIKDYSYIPQDSKEITVPDNTSDMFYNTNNYWGSTPTVSYSNPLGNKRCGGVTKAALGMALIDDEKYDNGNMPNVPIGPVNPVSWEPMMTVDTTHSKEESTPQGSGMDSIADQADAATGIKNKNDYGYGISNAVWNGLMFAGNFAEKMRNDKNKLASVAANLNNTQTPVMAMRGYDPTVNPTHLGYDADPSRLSVLGRYKCGGRKYAKGGIYDLTSKEIDEILKNGGKIEFIW